MAAPPKTPSATSAGRVAWRRQRDANSAAAAAHSVMKVSLTLRSRNPPWEYSHAGIVSVAYSAAAIAAVGVLLSRRTTANRRAVTAAAARISAHAMLAAVQPNTLKMAR